MSKQFSNSFLTVIVLKFPSLDLRFQLVFQYHQFSNMIFNFNNPGKNVFLPEENMHSLWKVSNSIIA